MISPQNANQELQALQALVAFAVDRPLTESFESSDNGLENKALEWAQRFRRLGAELRRQGYSLNVKGVTINRPMDHVAIEVIELACCRVDDEENSEEFANIVRFLRRFLSDSSGELPRFQEAVQHVLNRLIAFRF